ncbi:MAG: Flp family type IVb pilin [Nitrospinota bacterium]
MGQWVQWLRGEEGQGLMEYGLIVILVALGVISLLAMFGTTLNAIFNSITTIVSAA